jgi:NhaA family Na+:H+ antiporter
LVTVAIVDDMGAVAIIAIFYTSAIDLGALAAAAVILAAMFAMNRLGVRKLSPYIVALGLLWYATLLSGVHATIAGVLGAFAIPIIATPDGPDAAHSPLHRFEHAIAPWVGLLIVPIFGFANAGVTLAGIGLSEMFAPLPLGIAAGLFLGKQLGVFGGVVIAVKTGFASKPRGATWLQIYAVSMLCGIGFTMSLFIGGLAFPNDLLLVENAKIGILTGSLLSATLACLILRFAPQADDALEQRAKQKVEILTEGDVDRI